LKVRGLCTTNEDSNDNNKCTIDKCTKVGNWFTHCYHYAIHDDCSFCGANVLSSLWDIKNDDSDRIAISNTNITINNRTAMTASTAKSNIITSYKSSCIECGKYQFTITDNATTNFIVKVNNNETHDNNITSLMNNNNVYFTMCSSDEDCNDHNGCTVDTSTFHAFLGVIGASQWDIALVYLKKDEFLLTLDSFEKAKRRSNGY
jgi:hypothetical protein